MNVSVNLAWRFLKSEVNDSAYNSYLKHSNNLSHNKEINLKYYFEVFLVLLILLLILKRQKFDNDAKTFAENTKPKDKPRNRIKNLPRVSHIPFNIPYIDGILNIIHWRNVGVRAFDEWRAKYGSIFELPLHMSPTIMTVVTEPHIIQKVICSSEPYVLNKPRGIYKHVMPEMILDGLVGSEVSRWSHIKKTVSPIFTYKSLLSYIPFMNNHASNLITCLNEKASKGVVSDDGIYDLIYSHTIKTIMDILIGPEKCDDEKGMRFHALIKRGKEIFQQKFQNPILSIPFIWWFHPLKWEFDAILKEGTQYIIEQINYHQARRANGKIDEIETQTKPVCLADEMVKQGLPEKEISDAVIALFLPGHETTTMSINFTLFLLAKNQHCLASCQKEVDKIFSRKIQYGNNACLDMDDVQNLKYLERCILESLRVLPIIPSFARILDQPLKIDEETEFEAGRVIYMSPWLSHRDPKYFPDPEKYDPDRFLPEIADKRHPGTFYPFSRGPRNCIGWKIAMVEMKLIIAYIICHFDLSTTDELSSVKINQVLTLEIDRYYQLSLKKRRF